jgi:hypothetical protein
LFEACRREIILEMECRIGMRVFWGFIGCRGTFTDIDKKE